MAAAVQYGPGKFTYVSGCSDDNCGVAHYVTAAAQAGATHVVTPESALDQSAPGGGVSAELAPAVGDAPAVDSRWGVGSVIGAMAKLSDVLDITLVFNVVTYGGPSSAPEFYNSNIAVDATGKVLQVHHKFHLFSGETGVLTAGTSCCDSFATPAGQAGLLICADIQCVFKIALNESPSSCKVSSEKLLKAYKASQPRITFFSSYWMATGTQSSWWKPVNSWSIFAKWSGTYMVAANTIAGTNDKYRGGGIFDPDGNIIDFYDDPAPGFAIGLIPAPGSPPPPPPPAGKLVVTEIMPNPAAVNDTAGEWFEVYNPGSAAVDLKNWTIEDAGGSIHIVTQSVQVGVGKYVVLGNNADKATNGGVPVAYDYGSWSLTNVSDEVILRDPSGALVDEVAYGSSWPFGSGFSMSLKDPALDNASSFNWCGESAAWSGSAGDKGTPGAQAGCP